MNEVFQQYLIDRLKDSVARIGAGFERFGTKLIDLYVPAPMEHRGLDTRGSARGHTVDSVSRDGRIVAEYGAVKGYFSGALAKPKMDWAHVRKLYPDANRVILVSNELCGPKAFTTLMKLPSKEPDSLGITLEILDAEKIAKIVVEKLLPSDEAVDALAPFLPLIQELRDEYVATHLAPDPVADYLARREVESVLVTRLKVDKVAALSGLSGIGKSQTAAAVASAMRVSGDCGLVIWIDAREIDSVNALRGVVIDRRGRRANALALTRIASFLLVLDDLRVNLDQQALADACGANAYVLITRQTIAPSDVELPLLDDNEARRLLQHGLAEPVPEEVFETVWRVVGGHPLALRLLGSTAKEMGGWTGLVDECSHIAEYDNNDRPGRVADRLLARMKESAPRELSFLRWCGGGMVDPAFAAAALGFRGLRKLRTAGLFAVDSTDALRLHDIVAVSLRAVQLPVSNYAGDFELVLTNHIREVAFCSPHRLRLLRLVHIHGDVLRSLVLEGRDGGEYLYALLLAWENTGVGPQEIGDIRDRVYTIKEASGPVSDAAVLCIAEAVEMMFLRTRADYGDVAARQQLTEHVMLMETVEGANGISLDARESIRHHRAKALRRLGRTDEAIAICRELLHGSRPHASTRLLLARLLSRRNGNASTREAGELLLNILDEASAAPAGADLSVTLGAIEEFSATPLEWAFSEAWERHSSFIAEQIVAGATLGLGWAFDVLAKVATRWEWYDSAEFRQVVAQLPPSMMDISGDDRQLAARGRVLVTLARSADPEQCQAMLAGAVGSYQAMSYLDDFDVQSLGKAHVYSEHFAEAVALLEPRRENGSPWIRYWLSHAYLGLGEIQMAFSLIDELCTNTPDTDRFYSTYRRHRSHVRHARGDIDAVEDLHLALAACKDEKYRQQLADEIAEAERWAPDI